MKKIISFVLAFSMFSSVSAASLPGTDRIFGGEYNDYNINTPVENIFKIEGSEKEFILLDDENGFFVMAKNNYGKRAFDPNGTQKFDIEDTNNIAYWLNNEFLEKGNGTVELKLPDEIIKYIDTEHVWDTEAGFASGNCPEGYSTKSGVALLSQTEWRKYYKKFGCVDGMGIEGWWLRTPRAINGAANLVLASMTTQSQTGQTFGKEANNSANFYVRPVFYLTNEFFKNVKIDLETAGAEIISAMARHFNKDDLQNIYSDREIRNIGIDVPFELPVEEVGKSTDKNFLNGEYDTKLSTGNTVASLKATDEKQYIYTAFPKNPKHNYELKITFSCSDIAEKAVTLTQYTLGGDGSVVNKKDLIISGGNKNKREYAVNITDVHEDAEFVLLVIKLDKGNKGEFTLHDWCVKKLNVEADISHNWAPVYHLNANDEYFVTVRTDATVQQTFTTSYTLTYRGRDYTDKSTQIKLGAVKPNQTFTVPMKNMRYGSAILTIDVCLNGVLVESFTHEIVIMDEYDWNKFNNISRHGMNIGPGILDNRESGGEFLDMMQRAGFNETRSGPTWTRIESGSKGNYTYTISDTIMGLQEERGMKGIITLSFSNPLYTSHYQNGPVSPEEVEGFVNYTLKLLERYPQIEKIEIWNEPNNVGFWRPDGNVYAYANLVKATATAVRQYRPDVTIFAGAIDISKKGPDWTRQMFDLGIWDYIDGFSTHPYYHTEVNDVRFLDRVDDYTEIIEENGGWKDIELTEVGWTTYGKYDIEPTMAEEYIKILLHGDYLDTFCDLFNFADTNEAFGLLNVDFTAKPTYASVTNYNIRLADATFLTKPDINEKCHTFLYKKDGKPIVVSWCYTGEETTVTLPGNGVKAYDMYGNLIKEGNTIPQNHEPYYIYGVDSSFFAEAMSSRIISDYDAFLKRYKDNLSIDIKEKINSLKLTASGLSEMSEQEIKEFSDAHYQTGIELMKMCADDVFSNNNTNMYHIYHKIGLEISDYLMTLNNTPRTDGVERVEKLISDYESVKTDIADEKNLARDILRHAKRYAGYIKKAETNQNIERNNISGWNLTVNKLCDWYEYISTVEDYTNTGVYFNLVPPQIDYHEGDEVNAVATVYNRTSQERTGVVEVLDSDGKTVLSIPNVTVPENGKTTVDLKYFTQIPEGTEKAWNQLCFTSGDYKYTLDMALIVTTRGNITLEHSEVPFEQLSNVTFKVKNTTKSHLGGKLKITPPEGWRLAEDSKNFSIEPEGEELLTFTVVAKEQTAFNYYNFTAQAVDEEGRVIQNKDLLLDFSVIVKQDKSIDASEFTGDISDWSNAYPTYLNPPSDVDSMKAWQASDYAARIFSKWDEENFYLMVDAYDMYHNQQNSLDQLYAGDSIQVAIDANNTKSSEYDEDDYEYGFALDNFGKLLSYSWKAPEGKEAGEKPTEWISILRNEETKNTRYFVKIPKEDVSPMQLKEGNVIGLNLLLNDANLLGNRDHAVEITDGINSRKDPSSYRSWKMVNSNENTASWERIAKIFNPGFEATMVASEIPFDDISGHWAEKNILNAYNAELVKGVGDNKFMPDSELTVAESIQLVKSVFNLPDADYNNEFPDVSSDAWYSQAVASVNAAGLLPAEIISNGNLNPEGVMSREAFAKIIMSGKEAEKQLSYQDADSISEWAKNAVAAALEKGYMVGDDSGNFNPKKSLTRAEAATVMLKIAAK